VPINSAIFLRVAFLLVKDRHDAEGKSGRICLHLRVTQSMTLILKLLPFTVPSAPFLHPHCIRGEPSIENLIPLFLTAKHLKSTGDRCPDI
jgi:hypothetical protein